MFLLLRLGLLPGDPRRVLELAKEKSNMSLARLSVEMPLSEIEGDEAFWNIRVEQPIT